MATLVLQFAGAALGGALGGPIGAIAGRALGGVLGATIDSALINGGGRSVEGPRLTEMAGLGSTEGAAIPRVYGRARIGGELIWATRFEEVVDIRRQGGKGSLLGGGPTATNYSYFGNFAVGLCEGPIAFVRRVWADGREIDLTRIAMRVYRGDEMQTPDPLISAKEGAENAPAYRGLSYVVFERLALADFGNRIPQLSFEVVRPVGQLRKQVHGVNLIPGAGEFAYETAPIFRDIGNGVTRPENVNQLTHATDIAASLDQLLHPMIDPKAEVNVIGHGLPASPGAATGKVVFDPDEAEEQAKTGEKVILLRIETSPEDFHGMVAAQAILTARGGMTSHAAVVARGMGKCCVAGLGELKVDYKNQTAELNGNTIKKGDSITLNGSTGEVILGEVPLINPEVSGNFKTLMEYVNEFRKLGVRANADTPHDSEVARGFGAEGIGLCRTEHMFFEGDRIDSVRQMILSSTEYKSLEAQLANAKDADKAALEAKIARPSELYHGALAALLDLQREDFVGIFRAMNGFPVTIRTLDPPLHEFVPHDDETLQALATKLNMSFEEAKGRVDQLHEFNPMLGHRGCRLGIIYPEITKMQARAIFEAAVKVQAEGVVVKPEIMIPLVGNVAELKLQADDVRAVAAEVFAKEGTTVDYLVGTMIEVPRAALTANRIAEVAEFFSFGTNDLTQMTMGLSRDDSGKFLPAYVEKKIYADDPFQVLDQEGVGQLVDIGIQKGRSTKADLKIGICGEHGGEPESVMFCHRVGMNYVSCSPYRVPIALLAAAQAAIADEGGAAIAKTTV